MTTILFSFLTLLTADTVRADGKGGLRPISPRVDTSITYAVRGEQRQRISTYIEQVSRTSEGLLVVEANYSLNGRQTTLDSILLDPTTLAPRWHSDVTPMGKKRATFANGRIRGTSTDTAGKETPIDAAVPADAFDFSITSMIMAHLPFADGYTAVIRAFDIQRGAIDLPVRVVGQETLTTPRGARKTWKVEMDLAGRKVERWFDQETRQALRTHVMAGQMELVVEPPPAS